MRMNVISRNYDLQGTFEKKKRLIEFLFMVAMMFKPFVDK